MNGRGRLGHDFHFPGGSRVLSGKDAKSLMIPIGHFCRDKADARLCPAIRSRPRRRRRTAASSPPMSAPAPALASMHRASPGTLAPH